ncbi:acetyltransferase, GNAT family protein [Tritrichomonas foetus]|uniref:Acetyltransferase, GNAT family protein n=1 Tax=Tritrichomonas foetus TaxID=1144522 RepID=A0A1J4KHP0_9EUKA|nr:acetyltransferase, GNAT family protein [Tritrichomonas foetus]|eukprot:OHT08845.1 acetyltransferase, GNAT family protein [Tritrichomonas foetus]
MAEKKQDPISFGPVDKSTVGLLKIIHRELLPVHYTDNIYNVIKEGQQARGELAFFNNDVAVGEICYRLEEDESGKKKLYIMTIGVLKTYQHRGIATKLIDRAIENAGDSTEVYLHVHVENEAAMQFYTKLGFTKGDLIENYYKSLDNGNAYVFSKPITK